MDCAMSPPGYDLAPHWEHFRTGVSCLPDIVAQTVFILSE